MSKLPENFRNLTPKERLKALVKAVGLTADEVSALRRGLFEEEVGALTENGVGFISVPLGIAKNFVINGREVLVPMATEECSTVAAASKGAKYTLPHGFKAKSDSQIMQGTVQIVGVADPEAAVRAIERCAKDIYTEALTTPGAPLISHGGGLKWLSPTVLRTSRGAMVLLDFFVDCVDAMGANAVDEYAERIAKTVKKIVKGKVRLRILTNFCIKRLARAETVLAPNAIGGSEVVEGILDAQALADSDIFRAATHNKGIMNGIDAVLLATGNDWRAAEAGAHAQAACIAVERSAVTKNRGATSQYRSLTRYAKLDGGALEAVLEIPLAVGTVGGATNTLPYASVARKIMGISRAHELAEVVVSVGLSQNIAALVALVTEGIQKGHMRLHNKKKEMKKIILV